MNCYFDELFDKKLIEFWQFPGQAPEVPEESLRVPEQRRRARREAAGDGAAEEHGGVAPLKPWPC